MISALFCALIDFADSRVGPPAHDFPADLEQLAVMLYGSD